MVQLVTQYTAVTRQTPAAKSHPSGSNPLHLVPLERLRNLVATHPAAVGVEWGGLPCQQTGFTSARSLSLLKGMCTPLVCVLWVFYLEFRNCSFCLRGQCAAHRLFVTIVVP